MRSGYLFVVALVVWSAGGCADDGPMAESSDPGLEGIDGLQVAAQLDDGDLVRAMLDDGADPDQRSSNGMNALHHAAASGSVGAIEVLVRAGADVDEPSAVVTQGHGHPRDRNPTALAIAARADQLDAVAVLLDLGADPNATSPMGITPLYSAIFAGASPDLVDRLLMAGADPSLDVACIAGCSGDPTDALGWALRLDRDELADLLD